MASRAKSSIDYTSDFGNSLAYKICKEGHNDLKLAEMIEQAEGLLHLYCEIETSVCRLVFAREVTNVI